MQEPTINTELARHILVGFLRNEVRKFSFDKVVVGLSGGVDSSLAAFLAEEALGPRGVLAVMMPYKTSNPQSLRDAVQVAQMLGIEHRVIEITPMIDAYFANIPDADNVRRGNKMARERMSILYDLSHAERAIVMGTSNKTEALLGYTTLWGDMACGVNPLGDLYKTQVRALAAHLGVPEHIVAKNPTADLWVGQTDEAELGFTYAEVDKLLYLMVDERWERSRLIEAGFSPAFVDRVYRMVRDSQYKRRMPVFAKLSARTIDRDFRYSRDWGH